MKDLGHSELCPLMRAGAAARLSNDLMVSIPETDSTNIIHLSDDDSGINSQRYVLI